MEIVLLGIGLIIFIIWLVNKSSVDSHIQKHQAGLDFTNSLVADVHQVQQERADQWAINIRAANGHRDWASHAELSKRFGGLTTDGIHIGQGRHWNEKGHMLTVGGAGQGKGACLILPALLSNGFVRSGISIVVLDPKGENAAVAAPHLKRSGYDVHILNPFNIRAIADLGNSRFNPFDLIEKHETKKMCDVLAYSLHNRQSQGGNDFFDSRCRQYISLYMRYAIHIGKGDFGTVYKLLRYSGDKREKLLSEMATADGFSGAADAEAILGRLTGDAAKTEENIFITVEDATDILGDEALQDSLSKSDFDMRTIADKPTAIFICVKHDELRYYAAWVRILADSLLKTLTNYYNVNRKVVVLLDEFAQLGYLNQFKDSPAILRGYNVTLWPIVQEIGQLKDIYKDAWETFVSNSTIKHWFSGNMDNTTAEYLTKRMPNYVEIMGSKDGMPVEKVRPLISASELMSKQGIVCEVSGLSSPWWINKEPYWVLPLSKDNASPNPFY